MSCQMQRRACWARNATVELLRTPRLVFHRRRGGPPLRDLPRRDDDGTVQEPPPAPPQPRLVCMDEALRQARRLSWAARNAWNALSALESGAAERVATG